LARIGCWPWPGPAKWAGEFGMRPILKHGILADGGGGLAGQATPMVRDGGEEI
jgi:hypothetical protein